MTDTKLNQFLASGTAAERAAFTPDPPTPASGPDPTYIWFETDTSDTYAWDFGGAGWVQVNTAASSNGRLIGRQQFTSGSGTYTPTAGTNSVIIEMVGGGGGGAGAANPTGSNSSRAISGGGGAYLRKRLTANFSGASYSVGAAGAGGAAGANNGADGGDTTFTDTGATVYTAGKGFGGVSASASGLTRAYSNSNGGTATNGDINVPGGPSDFGFLISPNLSVVSGNGGSSMFSGGAPGAISGSANTSFAGTNAAGYGGGGSGAACNGTGGAAAGGNGSAGIIIIWEYS